MTHLKILTIFSYFYFTFSYKIGVIVEETIGLNYKNNTLTQTLSQTLDNLQITESKCDDPSHKIDLVASYIDQNYDDRYGSFIAMRDLVGLGRESAGFFGVANFLSLIKILVSPSNF